MRLVYNVLCIDDEIASLGDYKKTLRDHNKTVGIDTFFKDVEVKPSARETEPEAYKARIFETIKTEFSNYSFDLIMVDLHLGSGDMGFKGHEIISYIRDSQTIYRPIIFYSGGEPAGEERAISQLQDDIKDNDLVGKCIFLSTRGSKLTADLIKICSEMHREEHKLNATRGLLMDRTSEVDAAVLNHLRKPETWDALDARQSATFLKSARSRLKACSKSGRKRVEQFDQLVECDFKGLREWFLTTELKILLRMMDSYSRNSFLSALLRAVPANNEYGNIHSSYFNSTEGIKPISSIRNEYAHQTEQQLQDEHNDDRCKFVRDELRRHIANVGKLTGS